LIDPIRLVERHVDRFNQGVRTGDFGPMLEDFTDEAEVIFEGVPVGPFKGRAAIGEAYARRPPDDEIEILEVHAVAGAITVRYAWREEPGERGRMIITANGDRIARLVVVFEQSPPAGSAEPAG
jgi:hypothetical protein